MSIHQPRIDIFEMMTQIVFLTREGRVAYCGPTAFLGAYLERELKLSERVAAGLKLPGAFGTSGGGPSLSALARRGANPADELLDAMSVLEPQVCVCVVGFSSGLLHF